jgi:hypothetical protein
VNFNVNFNVLLNKYIVHSLVKIKNNFDNMKMHSTTVEKRNEVGKKRENCLWYFLPEGN